MTLDVSKPIIGLYNINANIAFDHRNCLAIGDTAVIGWFAGDDECFDIEGFYQYFVTLYGELIKVYYKAEDEYGNPLELDEIDYDSPSDYAFAVISDEYDQDSDNILQSVDYWIR